MCILNGTLTHKGWAPKAAFYLSSQFSAAYLTRFTFGNISIEKVLRSDYRLIDYSWSALKELFLSYEASNSWIVYEYAESMGVEFLWQICGAFSIYTYYKRLILLKI